MSVPTDRVFLTAERAAVEAGCTSTWIRKLLKRGDLPGVQVCGWTWLIDREDARALKRTLSTRAVSQRKHQPAAPKKARKKAEKRGR